ncbi:hypothetical protein CHS0354_008090 [Potamilus streckersoni]|uniref:Uncharacterized protein n=1 Tax=Potamilus streckersoni TaxID=2493646 RepID=A0AAE0SZE1_9BIVA|nr:hypothetical protein CHS0354_008090 [Potamilus streckersoni]
MECLERMKITMFFLFVLFVQAKRIYCDSEDPNNDLLVELHPPMNVTVAFHSSAEAFLFWYEPLNYENHEPLENETEWSELFVTQTPPNLTLSGLPSNKTDIHINSTDVKIQPNKTSENQTGSNSTSNHPGVSYNVSNSEILNQTILLPTKAMDKNSTATVKPPFPKTTKELGKNNVMVPFHKAKLKEYRVVYKPVESAIENHIILDENVTEVHLKNLTSNTNYSITVSAIYMTHKEVFSETIYIMTESDPVPACICDMLGSEGKGDRKCNMSLTNHPWCKCKPGYTGLFCESCAFGYYRLNPFMPCHACPCKITASSGSCHFVEGYLHCSYCNLGYTGNLCHKCANGFYRQRIEYPSIPLIPGDCIPCNCNNNTNPLLPDICDHSGKCSLCLYNTTGDNCEKCKAQFVGDPIKAKNCTHILHAIGHTRYFEPPAMGVIAGVIAGVLILLGAIVGFIVYKRMRHSKPQQPFWTIELKDDHEGVNFSTVPVDELQNREALEDMNFYEEHSGIARNGTQKYAPLRETM